MRDWRNNRYINGLHEESLKKKKIALPIIVANAALSSGEVQQRVTEALAGKGFGPLAEGYIREQRAIARKQRGLPDDRQAKPDMSPTAREARMARAIEIAYQQFVENKGIAPRPSFIEHTANVGFSRATKAIRIASRQYRKNGAPTAPTTENMADAIMRSTGSDADNLRAALELLREAADKAGMKRLVMSKNGDKWEYEYERVVHESGVGTLP